MQFEMNLPIENIGIASSQGPVAFEVLDGLAEFQKYQARWCKSKWTVDWRYILNPIFDIELDYKDVQLVADFDLGTFIDDESSEGYSGGSWRIGDTQFGAAGCDLELDTEFANLWLDETHLPIYSELSEGPLESYKFSVAGKKYVSDEDLSVSFALDFLQGE